MLHLFPTCLLSSCSVCVPKLGPHKDWEMPSWLLTAEGQPHSSLQCHSCAKRLRQRGQGCRTRYGGWVPGNSRELRLKGELAVHDGQMRRKFPMQSSHAAHTAIPNLKALVSKNRRVEGAVGERGLKAGGGAGHCMS